jgi:hypothetical protein
MMLCGLLSNLLWLRPGSLNLPLLLSPAKVLELHLEQLSVVLGIWDAVWLLAQFVAIFMSAMCLVVRALIVVFIALINYLARSHPPTPRHPHQMFCHLCLPPNVLVIVRPASDKNSFRNL